MTGWPAAASASSAASTSACHSAVAGGTQAHEDAIGAVDLGRAQRLAVHGHDARAVLAGRLRDELLQPGAQGRQVRLDDEGQLVAAGRARAPMAAPSTSAGLSSASARVQRRP